MAMVGSQGASNAPGQAKAGSNNNSATVVKAQLQMQSSTVAQAQQSVINAAGNGARHNNNSAGPTTDVASTASPATTTTTAKTNGAVVTGGENNNNAVSLKHDSGLATDWSAEEQAILDAALTKHAVQTDSLVKYIKIAALLKEKTVRDVALRVRWMTKKENGKRRKDETQNHATKKTKDKKDCKAETVLKQTPASTVGARSPGMPMYSPPPPPIDNDDGISNDAIGGMTGQLLEQNVQVIAQIRSNLASMKMQENTDLLVRFRDNIFAILNGMTNMPGIMSQMPPLPVKLNTELADSILPKSTLLQS